MKSLARASSEAKAALTAIVGRFPWMNFEEDPRVVAASANREALAFACAALAYELRSWPKDEGWPEALTERLDHTYALITGGILAELAGGVHRTRHVPNALLRQDLLPQAEAAWTELSGFALTFDGYGEFGTLDRLAVLHTEKRSATLRDLRGRLFFIQRFWKNAGEDPDASAQTEVREVMQQIRARVSLANKLME